MSNALAPEHLELAVENPMELLARVRHAVLYFWALYTRTGGRLYGRPQSCTSYRWNGTLFFSLSVEDFVKKSSIIFYGREALRGVYENVADFARMEGLPAHANAMEVRFYKDEDGIPS